MIVLTSRSIRRATAPLSAVHESPPRMIIWMTLPLSSTGSPTSFVRSALSWRAYRNMFRHDPNHFRIVSRTAAFFKSASAWRYSVATLIDVRPIAQLNFLIRDRECGGAKSYFGPFQLCSMAKRRKNRTHLKGAGGAAATAAAAGLGSEGAPKTFVVKHGPVGGSIAQLVRDVRKIMEPHTATRLRVWTSAYVDRFACSNRFSPLMIRNGNATS